jgi:membrane protein YqaA with SNARE-associated domain
MLQSLFDWMERYSHHKHAKTALAVVSFIESSFFPIPPFVMIIGMLSHEKRPSWVRLAIIGTIASVLGGIFAYILGKFFYDFIGLPLIHLYGIEDQVDSLGTLFRAHVFLTILTASLTPIPYKVFTLSAGIFSVNIWSFIFASLVGRSIRFFAVSYLAMRYGSRSKVLIIQQQKILGWIILVCTLCIAIYYLRT